MRWWYGLFNDRIKIIMMVESEIYIDLLIWRIEWRSVRRWRRMIQKNGMEDNDNDDEGNCEEKKVKYGVEEL